jgi:hypothetical protein
MAGQREEGINSCQKKAMRAVVELRTVVELRDVDTFINTIYYPFFLLIEIYSSTPSDILSLP